MSASGGSRPPGPKFSPPGGRVEGVHGPHGTPPGGPWGREPPEAPNQVILWPH